jgi:hypothetical protein
LQDFGDLVFHLIRGRVAANVGNLLGHGRRNEAHKNSQPRDDYLHGK